jgi:protein-disulfide isomerase
MRKEIVILLVIAVVVIVAAIVGTSYYQSSVQKQAVTPPGGNSRLNRADSPSLGPADAKVTVVEFLDPECESCRTFSPFMKQLLKDYNGRMRLVVRYMPLHPNSQLAATYTEAAKEQGKFWEMLEILFQRQPEWGDRHGHPSDTPQQPAEILFPRYATEVGLDLAKVREGIASKKYAASIDQDLKDGQSLGVNKTPSFFVNGRPLVRFGQEQLKALIDEEMAK